MDFSLYKNRLLEYLCLKNVEFDTCGNFRCINPAHRDSTPSCNLYKKGGAIKFHCFGCGCGGDIYDAVELLDGIVDKSEQFKYLESVFGGNYTPPPMKKIYIPREQKYLHLPDKYDEFEKYLFANPMREKIVREFLATRARVASKGEFSVYPDDVTENLVNFFGYFPGNEIARNEAGDALLDACNLLNHDTGKFIWHHSGVVLRLGTGFKLFFYKDGERFRFGSLGCSAFPMPGEIPPDAGRVVLVEGELDAVMCRAAGIGDVYAIGGTNGLTAPKIEQHLLSVKEIILMLDGDEAGLKTMGVVPLAENDKRKTPLPAMLRKAGFAGSIKIARLYTYNDPDDCILHRRADIVREAIANASEYAPPAQNKKTAGQKPEKNKGEKAPKNKETQNAERGRLDIKIVQAILKRLPLAKLEKADVAPFVFSVMRAVPREQTETAKTALREWGAETSLFRKTFKKHCSYLSVLICKYGLSYYYTHKVQLATTGLLEPEIFTKRFELPITDADLYTFIKDEDFLDFFYKRDEAAAANVIKKIFKNRIIYIKTEGEFYFYNNHIWKCTPNICIFIHDILSLLLKHYKENASNLNEESYKKMIAKLSTLNTITNIKRYLSGMPSVYKKEITFDGAQIAETLTLQDGVLDFSGKKIVFRNSKPEEYRQKMLPYTVDQVRSEAKPEKFLAFLESYFKDKETLKTLVYFLSTIGSRYAQFKMGGIFIGAGGTGKTTLMKFISEIYSGMVVVLPQSLIMSDGRKIRSDSSPSPYMARLEGAGCAFTDETERNARLSQEQWKSLTGGGDLTARGMWAQPRDFKPTAQIVIMSNYAPRFDGNDQAAVNRMVVINFRIQHAKNGGGAKTEAELRDELSPEYALMVRYFAERYIELKNEYKSVVPLSDECKAFRESYVRNQKTELQKFIDEFVEIDIASGENCKIQTHELYRAYCNYAGVELDANDKPVAQGALQLGSFTKAIQTDHPNVYVKQIKVKDYPVQFYIGLRLKAAGSKAAPQAVLAQPQPQPPAYGAQSTEMPEDNPF